MKIIFCSLITAVVLAGLTGCGKSELQKERDAARKKFKEAVAGLKVCTGGATYNEFRQACMSLRTSFEVNKSSLDDLLEDYVRLNAVMTASDYCWKKKSYSMGLYLSALIKTDLVQMQILNPSIVNNSKIVQLQKGPTTSYTIYQIEDDPDFQTHRYVSLGLSQIRGLCEQMESKLK